MLRYPFLLLSILLMAASNVVGASPSPVRGVRFGWHGAYARIVIDLEKNLDYRLIHGAEPTSVLIEFPGITSPPTKAVWRARNPLIQSFRFSQTANVLQGELLLNKPGTVQRHFRVSAPPRIVIDVTRQSPSAVPERTDVLKKTTSLQSDNAKPAAKQVQPPSETSPNHTARPLVVPSTQKEPVKQGVAQPSSSKLKLQALSRNQLLQQAEGQWKQGDLEGAYESYKSFVDFFPDYKHSHFIMVRLADILQRQQRLRDALEAYAAVIATYPATEGAVISKMRMAELGARSPNLLLDSDDGQFRPYQHPIQTLLDITRTLPMSPLANIAHFKIGEIQLYRNEPEAALHTFRQLFQYKLQPDLMRDVQRQFATTLQRHLVAKEQDGAFTEVLQVFFDNQKHLAPEDTADPGLLLPVAMSYARAGLLPEAQRLLVGLSEHSRTAKEKIVATLEQARILSKQGQIQDALDLLEPLVPDAEDSMQSEVLKTVADLAIHAKHPAKAIGYLEMAMARASDATERAHLLLLMAEGYTAQGDTQKGLQRLQQCVSLTDRVGSPPLSESEACHFRTANLLLFAGKLQEALNEYRFLLKTFPETPYRNSMLFTIAEINQKTGDRDQMIKTLQTLRNSTTDPIWQKMAINVMEHQEWQNQFGARLAELLNPSNQ